MALGLTLPGPSERLVPRGPGKTNDVDRQFFLLRLELLALYLAAYPRGHEGDEMGLLSVLILQSSPNIPSALHGSNGHFRGEQGKSREAGTL